MLKAHRANEDVPDDIIPDAITDLIAERFAEPELEGTAGGNGQEENSNGNGAASAQDEDRAALTEEKLVVLRTALVTAKQKLMNLENDEKALQQERKREVENVTAQWKGEKAALRLHLKEVRAIYKARAQKLKDAHKALQKAIKSEITLIEKQIPVVELELKLFTNRGKLTLILEDADLIGTLKERWIAAEVAKQLDYPIFMAVSERGGKYNSGDYKHLLDENGSLREFPEGHPQAGQLVIDQDLVNYDLRLTNLAKAAEIPDEELCVAEAFVRFAQEQKFSFWEIA